MAQWDKLLGLDLELQRRVVQVYEGRFPREIRQWLRTQIESHDWRLAAGDGEEAAACLRSLLEHLEQQWRHYSLNNMLLVGPNFAAMRDYLLKTFKDNPTSLAVVLRDCLMEEKKILDSVSEEQPCSTATLPESNWTQLDAKIKYLKSLTLEMKKDNISLEDECEGLTFIQVACRDQGITEGMKEQVPVEQHVGLAQSLANVQEKCQRQADGIAQKRQMLLQNAEKIVNMAGEILLTLTDVELPQWKRRQQLACIGSPEDTSLDRLQDWFTSVMETLLELREQLQKLQQQNRKHSGADASAFSAFLEGIEKKAASMCIHLLQNALVVEKQPFMSTLPQRPLIVKTGVRFTASVRFLAKFKCLLKVRPVIDKDVKEASAGKGSRRFSISQDNFKFLDEDMTSGGLVAEFCHLSLKEEKVKVKGSTETRLGVTEELHLLTFVTDFQHAGLKCTIEASSLPVVVISSSNQVASAWASILWCNTLAQPTNLSFFADPPPLAWTQLSQVVSWQFLTVGRKLDENQLIYLKDKLVDDPNGLVHWTQFSKDNTTWIWIYGILELIKKHLSDIWKEGLIMGFVSKETTNTLLQERQHGTFLLRFSESNKEGAITFSWVERINDEPHVHNVQPYTKEELTLLCLPDIINLYSLRAQNCRSSNPLVYLYPDIPKDRAFERFYKVTEKLNKNPDGYVLKMLVPVSMCLTPPPSPPPEIMDLDLSTNLDVDQLLNEFFPEFFKNNGEHS